MDGRNGGGVGGAGAVRGGETGARTGVTGDSRGAQHSAASVINQAAN